MSDCAAIEGYLEAFEAGVESARESLIATFRAMTAAQVAECLKIVAERDAGLVMKIAANPQVDISRIEPQEIYERDERLYGDCDPIAGF